MNFTTAVFLINKDVRAVIAEYEEGSYVHNGSTYVPVKTNGQQKKNVAMFKTLDPDIKKDDHVVVPTSTRHGLTVVKVVDVDVTVDFDASEQVDWVVSKIDLTDHKKRLAQEAEAIETIKKAEFAKRRRELFASVIASEDADMIKQLPIYKNGSSEKPLASQNDEKQTSK